MKVSKLLAFVVGVIFAMACDTSSNVEPSFERTFLKYYGNEGDQSAADLVITEDAFFLLGNSTSLSGEKSAFLIKTTLNGDVLWERRIGGANEIAVDIESVPGTGNLVVAMNVGPEQSSKIRIVRLRAIDGVGLDSAMLPLHPSGGFKQVVRSVTPLASNEFVVVGYADGNLIEETDPIGVDNDFSDILAIRLDGSLTVVEQVVNKGGEKNGSGIKAFELPGDESGKLVLFSYSDRPKETDAFGFNFSYDVVTQGIPVGKMIGSEQKHEILSTVVEVPAEMGAGFLMAGTASEGMDVNGNIYLVKYDDELMYKGLDTEINLGRNVQCVSAAVADFAYYVLCNEMTATGFRDIHLSRVTTTGEVDWSKSFGTRPGDDTAAAIGSLPDGRIVIAGTVQLQTRLKVSLMVLNKDGSF